MCGMSEKYFEQAKSMDPGEPYLYVLKGSWSMKGDAGGIEIDDYIKAINNAAKYKAENKITDDDISEINRIIWLHLGAKRIPDRTKSEALMLANAYREMDWRLSKWRVEKALEYTWQMFRSADESKHIAAKLGLDNMNLTYEWLLEVLQKIRALSPLEKLEDQYARARLAELKGDRDKALAKFKKIRLVARALERRLRDDNGFHTRLRRLQYATNQDLSPFLDMRIAWLGIDSRLLEADEFKQLTGSPGEGFLVDTVAADGPAARAGIRPRDVILKRDDWLMVASPIILSLKRRPQETITLTVHRQGIEQSVAVELGAIAIEEMEGDTRDKFFATNAFIDARLYDEGVLIIPALHAVLSPPTTYLREVFDIKAEENGVIILNVEDWPTWLIAGDLVLKVEDRPVVTPREFWQQIVNVVDAGKDRANLTVSKSGEVELISLELPEKENLFVIPDS